MYFDFFGLKAAPFNNTPDPRFFFNTPDHEEALASLLYAVQERKGFVLVTGEVGAGKTLLSRIVLNRLGENVRSALVTHTRLTGPELLYGICREFGIEVAPEQSSAVYMRHLETFLLEQYAADRLAVVMIDEAQNLSIEAIEELRMLGNLEADDAKLLQVLLLGQPELQEKFRDPALKQTYQRVFRTFHLKALDRKLSRDYVLHRLRVAGMDARAAIFHDAAFDAIHGFSEGIPRLINQLCDNALLAAYGASIRVISADFVADVVDQMMSLSAVPPVRPAKTSELDERGLRSSQQAFSHDNSARESAGDARAANEPDDARLEIRRLRADQQRIARALRQTRLEMKEFRETRSEAVGLCEKAVQAQDDSRLAIRKASTDADAATAKIQSDHSALLSETRTQNALLQEQMHTLLAQLKSRDEAAVRQAAELAAMHESELAGARQRFDALFAQMEEQSARFDADHRNVIEAVNSQAGGLVERLAEIERRAETTGQQVHKASDRFVLDVQARAANAQQRLEAATSGVERQLRVSTEKFAAMRDGVLSDAEEKRRRAEGLAVQTQAVLGETRARCNAMLEDLRLRIEANKRNEQVVSACVAAGAATLGELTEKLADAREAATRSRGDLEKLIHGAAGEVIAARGALEDTMQGHRSELGRLSNDAAGLRVDFQSRFEEARASLESLIQEHRQKCSQRVEAFVGSVDHRLAHAELEASTRVTSLQGDLRVAAEAASRISAELQTTIEAAEARLRETQACFTRDAEAAQRNINRLVEKNQATLDATRTQVESLTRQAGETAASMRIEISSLKEMAHSRINRAGVEFSQFLDEASKKVDVIRQESAAVASDLAEQCAQSTDEAAGAVAESEKAAVELRRQSQLALVEVRDCLGQISGRADDLRREFCNLGDELTTSARTSAVQVQKAGDRITGQIETMREAVQRDADANFRRLSLFREQVEKSAEQMRDHAGRLLDQVNDGAAGLRKHADELLMRAQSGAERIGETAGKLLDDARLSSERFQQQAEQLLQSTESSAASLREQLHSLKAHVMGESEEIRQKIAVASHDLADARSRVEQIGEKTDAAHQRTETKTGELLREVNAVQQKSESLLAMPKELVDEARLQAEALSQMSRKISAALKQLGIAEANASQNKSALAEANEAADQKIDLMKRHTQRIGQLVGIVRQLYGTMDARIERLRGRLTQADDLVRDVPREIESLRAAFEFENNQPIEAGGSDGAISSQRGVAVVAPMRAHMNPPKRITTSPDVSPAKPSRRITGPAAAPAKELRHAAVVTSSPSLATLTAVKGSLGELVQKNQKLNQWLKDMVGEEALEARIGHQSGAAQA